TEPPVTPAVELGVDSFGNTPRSCDGGYGASAQAVRDVLEAVRLANQVGLDAFSFGEHHTPSMPLSSPTPLVLAPAALPARVGAGARGGARGGARTGSHSSIADSSRLRGPGAGDVRRTAPGPTGREQ